MLPSVAYGSFMLKAIVICHLVLTIWASLDPGVAFLPKAYTYMNVVVQLYGALSIIKHKSADSILMFLLLMGTSVIVDIVLLSIYNPALHDAFEGGRIAIPTTFLNTYRFALGMAVLSIILKPAFCFVLYRIYIDRGGNLGDAVAQLRFRDHQYSQGYENLDRQPTGPNVETATPHTRITIDPQLVPN